MAVETLTKSDMVSDVTAEPVVKQEVYEIGPRVRYARSVTTTTGTTTTSGSTYLVLRLPSNAIILYGTIRGVGSIDLPNVDVGARQVASPNTTDDDSYATALDIDDTGAHDFVNFMGATYTFKPIFRYADASDATFGSTDPGGMFDIHVSLDADAVAAGDFITEVLYVID